MLLGSSSGRSVTSGSLYSQYLRNCSMCISLVIITLGSTVEITIGFGSGTLQDEAAAAPKTVDSVCMCGYVHVYVDLCTYTTYLHWRPRRWTLYSQLYVCVDTCTYTWFCARIRLTFTGGRGAGLCTVSCMYGYVHVYVDLYTYTSYLYGWPRRWTLYRQLHVCVDTCKYTWFCARIRLTFTGGRGAGLCTGSGMYVWIRASIRGFVHVYVVLCTYTTYFYG